MRRTDRLYDLIQTLRDGRLHRAGDLAQQLAVTPRTIWRDMGALMASGMPIEGERGVGYILRIPLTLPPMMVSPAELEALRTGLRAVMGGGDAALARAAKTLAGKIAAVTPRPAQASPEMPDDVFAGSRQKPMRSPPHIPALRRAIRARLRVSISHIEPQNIEAHSDMLPLYLDLKSTIWTLIAYCEGAHDFRVLRLDKITAVTVTAEQFARTKGRELADFRARNQTVAAKT
jgi:predicted DNA-binding transcriptional regulator YafY